MTAKSKTEAAMEETISADGISDDEEEYAPRSVVENAATGGFSFMEPYPDGTEAHSEDINEAEVIDEPTEEPLEVSTSDENAPVAFQEPESMETDSAESEDNASEETPISDKTLAEEYLLEDFDDFLEMREQHFGIPYYIPSKRKLLKYTDDFYFEKTMEYIDLRAFLRNLPYLTKERADDIAEDVLGSVAFGENEIDFGISEALRMGVDLEDDKVRKEFLRLLLHLDKNVRKHAYCGHTKQELLDMHIYE